MMKMETGGGWRRGAAMLTLAAMLPVAAIVLPHDAPAAETALEAKQRRALANARAEAAAADRRTRLFEQRADAAGTEAARLAAERAALDARLDRAVADVRAAEARMALLAGQRREREARLADARGPLVRLSAALTTLARRPVGLTLVQPGSIRDVVHLQAVIGAVGPDLARRTAALRTDIEEGRALEESIRLSAAALGESRRALSDRRGLARAAGLGIEPDAAADDGDARDRLLASAQASRAALAGIDRIAESGSVDAALLALPGPRPRPAAADPDGPRPVETSRPAYRLPAAARIVDGTGEATEPGYRTRGLTLAVAAGSRIVAPAGGTIRFAAAYRSYGGVVIIDHGDGWTSLIAGLDALAVKSGTRVAVGDPLGTAAPPRDVRAPGASTILVELRRRGKPMDVAALL